ncbi:MAG: alpha/beta hydrolase [Pseudomonadales bacterium]|nr:alpha/beta hydrolase [Pseudomonadales bacterium]
MIKRILKFAGLAMLVILPALSKAQAAELIQHTVMSEGHHMAVWEKSVDNPKGIILLHHGRTWSSIPDFDLQVPGEDLSLMDGFNEQGYSVWALDARGYGETPRDASGWNTPDKAARDLANVLAWLSERSGSAIDVWGWSYGSMIAQLTAQQYPQNFRSLTLFGYPVDPETEYRDSGASEPARATNTAEAAASDFIVDGSISQQAIDVYVREALRADPVRADWNQLQQWNALNASEVTVPTLLLQAEFDPLADTGAHARVFTELANPNKQWIVLAGGDHAALLETPRQRLIQASVTFMQWLDL